MAAFSVNKSKNKKQPIGFGRKTAKKQSEPRPSSVDPDETQIPGTERDPSQTPIQPNAGKRIMNRARSIRSKVRESFLRRKAMVGVWNVAVF